MKGAKPRAGDRVSEYVLDERLGAGGYGEVWKAFHAHLPDVVAAVKIPTDQRWLDQLKREGTLLHRLKGEHVVEVRGLDPYADPPYLVMEYVDGKSLRQVLSERRPLPPKDALEIYRQALLALQSAHRAGVIHRDVKPENILLSASGTVKLTDFGLGRCLDSSPGGLLQSVAAGASAVAVAGTIRYMSPEQRTGGHVDARADIYSLGLVLFEMLAGDTPQGAELPTDLNPALPKWADRIVSRCYTRLERRYGSATEAIQDLDRLFPNCSPGAQGGPGPAADCQAPAVRQAQPSPGPLSALASLAVPLRRPGAPAPAQGRPEPPGALAGRLGASLRDGGGAAAVSIIFLSLLAAGALAVLANRAGVGHAGPARVARPAADPAGARAALAAAYAREDWRAVWAGLSRGARKTIAEEDGYQVTGGLDAGSWPILRMAVVHLGPGHPPGVLEGLADGVGAARVRTMESGPGRAIVLAGTSSTNWIVEDGHWKLDDIFLPRGAPSDRQAQNSRRH